MLTTRLSRELVYSSRGIVCSNSPLAASAGIRVMQEGGNAFDAALAVAAAEAVTLVPFCGMGGDSFILLYQASSGKVTEVNSSGVAATGATADYYRSLGHRTMPLEGPHTRFQCPVRWRLGKKCTGDFAPSPSPIFWTLRSDMRKRDSRFPRG